MKRMTCAVLWTVSSKNLKERAAVDRCDGAVLSCIAGMQMSIRSDETTGSYVRPLSTGCLLRACGRSCYARVVELPGSTLGRKPLGSRLEVLFTCKRPNVWHQFSVNTIKYTPHINMYNSMLIFAMDINTNQWAV